MVNLFVASQKTDRIEPEPEADRNVVQLPEPAEKREETPRLRVGNLADLKFCDSLQTKFKGCLGYFSKTALEHYISKNRVMIGEENEDHAGYILGAQRLRYNPMIRPIFQAAVAMDAQRRHLGLQLVQQTIDDAKIAGQQVVQANCAAELEANHFWEAAGFQCIFAQTPPTKSARIILTWRYSIDQQKPTWFTNPPTRAGHTARRTYAAFEPLNLFPIRGESHSTDYQIKKPTTEIHIKS